MNGSAAARAALVAALVEAARRGAVLEVVAAYRPDRYWVGAVIGAAPGMDTVREDTEMGARELLASVVDDPMLVDVPGVAEVPVDLTLMQESPAVALVGRSDDAELLVVGSRGRGAVRSALLGSVALHCVTHARCPVLVVHDSPGRRIGTVLVGVDGPEASAAALGVALEEAGR